LVDTPGLLFAIELEIHVEDGTVLNPPPQPLLRAPRDAHGQGEGQQALGHPSVAIKQGDVGGEHEVF
jgi:hypothetical protein